VLNPSPVGPKYGPFIRLLLGATLGLLAACADAPEEVELKASHPIPAPLLEPAEAIEIGPLDAFGNLKGSDEWTYGFELPMSSVVNPRAKAFPVVFVPANRRRLLRFYRSRGHTLIKTMTGWRVTHSDRTLAAAREDIAQHREAVIVMTQGPGSGYTLRFHGASPNPLPKRAVELLVEAERAAEAVEGLSPTTATRYAKRDKMRRLRAAAFEGRPDTTKATDLSERIYQHMKGRKDGRFRD